VAELAPLLKSIVTAAQLVIKFISIWQRQEIAKIAKKENIKDLFGFIEEADISTGNIPPDDVDSLRFFRDWFCQYFSKDRRIEYHKQLAPPDISKHLCSIGGPVDHLYTRYTMGYDKKAQSWAQILPYYFPLKDAEDRQIDILREYKGFQWRELNWYIADRKGKPVFVPAADKEGVLNKDYFMLIVAPNTFTQEAFYRGQKHMIIACAHGLAQLAVREILDNDEILKEIKERSKGSEYFQAIVEVQAERLEIGYVPILKSRKSIPRIVVEPIELGAFKNVEEFREWI